MNRKFDGNKWTAEILCTAFVVAGAGLFIYGLVELNRVGRSREWPSVKGKVVYMAPDSGGGYDVMYTYKIGGQTFKSNKLDFSHLSNRDDTRRVVRQYPEGKIVDVYYDPNDPEISVLEPGFRPGMYSMPGFGLCFALAAIGFLFLDRRMRPRRSRTAPTPDGN